MWFKKKHTEEQTDLTVELRAHKQAMKRQVANLKLKNNDLLRTLDENGFIFQIALAAGGKHSQRHK